MYENAEFDASQSDQDENTLNFVIRLLKILFIHRWIFIPIVILVAALVMWYGMRQVDVYKSDFEVFYNESMKEYADKSDVPVIRYDFNKNYWLKVMVSDELMQLIADHSGLPYSPAQLKRLISVSLMDKRKDATTPIFQVSVSNEDRSQIPLLIRAYMTALNTMLVQYQVDNSNRLIQYLNEQIEQNSSNLSAIDMQILSSDKSREGAEIVDFERVKSNLAEFRRDLLQTEVNLSSITAARLKTQNELRTLDGTIVNESAFTEPLKVQLMNLEVDLARALTKHMADHPTVKQIKNNIVQINSMLRDSIEQRLQIKSLVANPLKTQLMSKLLELQISEISESSRVESLRKIIREMENLTLPNAINQDQQQLLRSRELVFLTLTQLNDRLIEAKSASYGSLNRFVFVDDPNAITLMNKGMMYYLIIALFAGFTLATLVVFAYDFLDDRIMLVSDYERFYTLPLLGIIRRSKPTDTPTEEEPAYAKGNDVSALVVNLRQQMRRHSVKNFAIASSERKEGKTYISQKIAKALAEKNMRVLLVDLDFFAPRLTVAMSSTTEPGIANYLDGEDLLFTIIKNTETKGLQFIGAGQTKGKKEMYYHYPNLAAFVAWANEKYDVVLYDTPAATCIPDIHEFLTLMDAIQVVVRLRVSTRKSLGRLLNAINQHEKRHCFAIINDVHSRIDGDTYYNYEYKHKYNYENEAELIEEATPYPEKIKARKQRNNAIVTALLLILFVVLLACVFVYRNMPETYATYYYSITDLLKLR